MVEELYDKFLNADTRWDIIEKEVTYYDRDDPKRTKGEFDILLYDEDTRTLKYIEVKTNPSRWRSAEKQLKRARDHFEPLGINFEGELYTPAMDQPI